MVLLDYLEEWLINYPPTPIQDNRKPVITITDFREVTRTDLNAKIKQRQRYDRDKIIKLYRKFVQFYRRPPHTLEEFCKQNYAPSRATVKKFFSDLNDLISTAGPVSIPSSAPKTQLDPALNQRALKAMQLRSANIQRTQHIGFDRLTRVTQSERQRLQEMTQKHTQTERAESIAYRLMERWMTFQTKSRDEYLHRITMVHCYYGNSDRIHRADYYGFNRIVCNIEYRLENNLAIDDATLIRTLTPIREAWRKELAAVQAAETLEAEHRAEKTKNQANETTRQASTNYVTDIEWHRRTIEQAELIRAIKTEPRPVFIEPSDDEWSQVHNTPPQYSHSNQTQQTRQAQQTQQTQQSQQSQQSQRTQQSAQASSHNTTSKTTSTNTSTNTTINLTDCINIFVKDILKNTASFLRNLFS